MQQKLSIEYEPILSHAVVQSAAAFLLGLSLLDLMLTLTNLIRYDFWPPAEFHLAPLLLILMCGVKIRLDELVLGIYDYRITVFGIEVMKNRFTELVCAPRGKFVTLIGINQKGASKTFITTLPSKAQLFSQFTRTA